MTITNLFDIEEKCEGKTIFTLSVIAFGVIIRFTDGSKLTVIKGSVILDESEEN